MVIVRLVIFLIQMTMFYEHTGDIPLCGMTDDSVIVGPPVVKSRLDPSGIQTEFLQKFHLYAGKTIAFAVVLTEGGHPALRPEQRMVFRHIKMQTEQEIRPHPLCKFTAFVKRQLLIPVSGQIHGDALILFQLFFHGPGHDYGHLFFGIIFIFASQIVPTVTGIYHNTQSIRIHDIVHFFLAP